MMVCGVRPMFATVRHLGWTCRVCDATFFWPPTDPTCSLLSGAARVR